MSTQKNLHRRSSHQKSPNLLSPQNKTRRSKRWWVVSLLLAAIIGGTIGYFHLPQMLLAFARILLGASLGIFGLGLLMVFFAHPEAVLEGSLEGIGLEGCVEGCVEGCFSLTFVLLISMIGAVGGLLVWHSLLLGVLTGATNALVALIIFVGLALPNRKEEIFHRSKANAPLVSLE